MASFGISGSNPSTIKAPGSSIDSLMYSSAESGAFRVAATVAMWVKSGPIVAVDVPSMVWQPVQPLVEKTNRPGSGAGVNTKVGPTAKVGSSPRGGGVDVGFPQAKRSQINCKGIGLSSLFMFQSAPLNRLSCLLGVGWTRRSRTRSVLVCGNLDKLLRPISGGPDHHLKGRRMWNWSEQLS